MTHTAYSTLPTPIWHVYRIVLYSWLGWWAVLFLSTSWVSQIYLREAGIASGDLAQADPTIVDAATQAGSRAMLFHAILAFATSIVIPLVITENGQQLGYSWIERRFRVPGFTVAVAWMTGLALFAVLMLSTSITSSVIGASIIVALTGYSWSLQAFAPFALLGELITLSGRDVTSEAFVLVDGEGDEDEEEASKETISLKVRHSDDQNGPVEQEEQDLEASVESPTESTADRAGVILGLLNVCVVIPQLLMSLVSSVLFKLLEGRTDTLRLALQLGGVGAAIGAWLAFSFSRVYK